MPDANKLLIVLTGLALVGCGGGSGNGENGDNGEGVEAQGEGLRFVHSLLDQQGGVAGIDVEVDINDTTITADYEEGLPYTEATGYVAADDDGEPFEGEVDLEVYEIDDDGDRIPYVDTTVELGADTAKTAILTGDDPDNPELEIVDEHNDGGTSVRLSHFAEDLDSVDVYLPQGEETAESVSELDPVKEAVDPGTVGEWMFADAGDDTRLWLTEPDSDEIVFASGETTSGDALRLSTGDHVHLVLTSLTQSDLPDSGFSDFGSIGLVDSDSGTDPVTLITDQRIQLQLINAVADSDPVDIRIEDEALYENLAYQEGSEIVESVPGTGIEGRDFEVVDSDGNQKHEESLGVFESGSRIIVVLMGSEEAGEWVFDDALAQSLVFSGPEDEIAAQAAYAHHGFDSDPSSVDFNINDSMNEPIFGIEYQEVTLDVGDSFFELNDPGSDNEVAFYEDCSSDGACDGVIVEDDIEDLEAERNYTFVLGKDSDGSDPDLFHVQAPWEEAL